MRLTKLLRIMRASRLFERFEETLTVRYGCARRVPGTRLRLRAACVPSRALSVARIAPGSVLKLWKFMLVVGITSHWLACMWALIPVLNPNDCNWINKCAPAAPPASHARVPRLSPRARRYFTGDGCLPIDDHVSHMEVYVAALCASRVARSSRLRLVRVSRASPPADWSVMTVATVGYGDVPPENRYERLYATFAMYIVRARSPTHRQCTALPPAC